MVFLKAQVVRYVSLIYWVIAVKGLKAATINQRSRRGVLLMGGDIREGNLTKS